ncbi:MAG TPA: cytochrome c oxidase assembly protein [Solirubrobacteraceae bacterium]|nr:cytochrome c oxidase assembly protein [Solirubrobacteraceae bacterium]
MEWSFEPGVIAWLVLAEALYVRAVRTLAGRGVAVPAGQQALWHAGVALQAIGLLSPVDALGDQLLSAHMAQHLLIADLAAPLLLAGLRNPVLVFFLPREVLVPIARRTRLRAAFRTLRRPLVAIPVYTLVLYGWHIGPLFEAAVRHPVVHAVQHASFIGIGMLVWWSVLEPKRRRPRGALWKMGHIIGARMLGMMLGMSFVLIRSPVYTGVYGSGERRGLEAVADQQLAGAMMVIVDIGIMVFALAYFFWRAAQQHDLDEARERARAAT